VDLVYSHQREQAHAEAMTANLARVLDEHLSAVIGKIDVALQSTVSELQPAMQQGRGTVGAVSINQRLQQVLATIPESQSLRVLGADGHFRFDASGQVSSIFAGDRQYFLRNRDDPQAGLVISEPIFARLTNNWVITLSRQIRSDDGRFLGLLQAAVRADYFDAIYQEIRAGEGASLAIRDQQMRLFVRKPEVIGAMGLSSSNHELERARKEGRKVGHYVVHSEVDQVERLYAFRFLEDYPFVITSGLALTEIYADWQRKVVAYALLAVLLLGCIALIERLWRQRYRKAFELAEEMTAKAMATDASLQQARRRLLSNISHELRTPLNGILGMTQILATSELNPVQQKQLRLIDHSGQRLLRVVNLIGKYMQLDAEEYVVKQELMSLAELVDTLRHRFTPRTKDLQLGLRIASLPAGLDRVRGDGEAISFILNAFLDNACKFTPSGTVDLLIDAEPLPEPQVKVRFTVRDTGIGMDPAASERLFQPFTPLDDSATRHRDGSGLELALCYRLAEVMGGTVGAASNGSGQGSSFWLELPLLRAD
jgi:signal transduction histidine kinase